MRWTLTRIPLYLALILGPLVFFEWSTHYLVPPESSIWHMPLRNLLNLAGTGIILAIYAFLVRRVEHRAPEEITFSGRSADYLLGFTVGAAILSVSTMALWAAGNASFAAGTVDIRLVTQFVAFLCVGILEELLGRAVIFRIVEQACGTAPAVAASAIIFGLIHGFNENATVAGTLFIALGAGPLLALAFAWSRNLWFAAGLHLGWNFFEGNVFGGAVSGMADSPTFVRTVFTGPDILTGGVFGLEGSAVTLAVTLAASFLLGVLVVRRGHWRPLTRFRFSLA